MVWHKRNLFQELIMDKQSLTEKLTLLSLRFKGKKFLYKEELELPNKIKLVGYVYEKEETDLARITFLKSLTINRKVFELSKNAQDYILLHEFGHKKIPLIADIIFDILIIPASILLLCTIPLILMIIISIIFPQIINPLVTITALPTTILPFVILQYLSEGHADYYAIKQMTPKKYLEAINEIRQKNKKKRNWLNKIIARLSYPKPEWIIKIYQKQSKKSRP